MKTMKDRERERAGEIDTRERENNRAREEVKSRRKRRKTGWREGRGGGGK